MPTPGLMEDGLVRLVPVDSKILARGFGPGWECQPADAALQHRDAAATRAALEDFVPDLVVVDHYLLDREWEDEWRGFRLLVIDDLANRQHACDALLDQTFGRAEADYRALVPKQCMMMLGSRFALLRPEFADLRTQALEKRARTGSIETVLVNFGGSDIGGLSGPVIEYLLSLEGDFDILLVCGSSTPTLPALRVLARHPRVRLETDPERMAMIMLQADLAIGAGGVTAWERCTMGLPTILIPVAANQALLSENMEQAGAAVIAEDVEGIGPLLSGLQKDFGGWHDLVAGSAALCDGHGASRVAAMLTEDPVCAMHLRPATHADSLAIWAWRNDPLMRHMSVTQSLVRLPDHQRWFTAIMSDPQRCLMVGEIAGEPVGVVRFDLDDGTATVSINVAPAWRGRSLGGQLLDQGVERYAHSGLAKRLIARVRLENKASRTIFRRSGFQQVGRSGGFITFEMEIPTKETEYG